MFIQLTNVYDKRKGDPLFLGKVFLNVNHIVSVYEEHVDGGSLSARIYTVTGNIYHVEESYMEITGMILALK